MLIALAMTLIVPLAADARPTNNGLKVGGMEVLGRFPEPSGNGINLRYVIEVDEERRLLYYLYTKGVNIYIREYDLRAEVPVVKRETYVGTTADIPIGFTSPYTMQIDKERGRLLMMVNGVYGSKIQIVDLNTFKLEGEWDVGTAVPGFVGHGMTYSEKDGRVYMVGSMSGNVVASQNVLVSKPGQVSAVVALDASAPAGAPERLWVRPIHQCQQVMDTFTVGALIARSDLKPALYFACVRANPWPGESGIVRMTIDPKAEQEDATAFPVEFFPISGDYSGTQGILGVAAFDYSSDRFYVQSLARLTPGAWVFDGRLSSWVGFIGAPDASDLYMGLDQSSGHYYLAGSEKGGSNIEGAYLVVSDGRASPIPQGQVENGLGATGFIFVDPTTHRLFVPMKLSKMGYAPADSIETGYVVLKDETPLEKPPAPLDYDELTTNIPEGPTTITNFSGNVNGFGARTVLVGGYGGVLSASGQQVPLERIRSGDRGFTAARVPSVDVRGAGATASSQPFVSDSNTDAELTDAGVGPWPWAPATCLDGSGEGIENASSGPGGNSAVRCDLSKESAEASADFGLLTAGDVTIGSSSFRARAWRDAKQGVVTGTVATARGIELPAADGGTVSIAQVEAIASTAAHGRPKTASAEWERRISGVEVTDAEGKVTQELGSCVSTAEEDQCSSLTTEINKLLEVKMRVSLPEPAMLETPKGAFSGVQQTDKDFYEGKTVNNQGTTFAGEAGSRAVPALQVTVFNDSMEKSRLIVQLAGLQANSIYTNSPQPGYDVETPPVEPPAPPNDAAPPVSTSTGSTGGAVDTTAGGGGTGGGSIPAASGPVATAPTVAQAPEGVLAFLTRGPKEALLFAGVWLLFGGAGAAFVRRRSLLSVLDGMAS
jgi:hypothetical protein